MSKAVDTFPGVAAKEINDSAFTIKFRSREHNTQEALA
jgi:hypothetical protein